MLEIFPAIDLKDGQAVRLLKGEMQSAKIYGNPLEFAKHFEQVGVRWIHIVDLDGAVSGAVKNIKAIEQIRRHTSLKIQLGGGIRDEQTIQMYQNLGINRLILGSVALQNPEFAQKMAQKYKIAISIDSKNGKVAINGWSELEEKDALDLASDFQDSDIEALICTDISRDGALSGINVDFTIAMAKASQKFIIASGGFSDLEDLKQILQGFSAHNIKGGVIIGKAFYEGKINLKDAFKIAQPTS